MTGERQQVKRRPRVKAIIKAPRTKKRRVDPEYLSEHRRLVKCKTVTISHDVTEDADYLKEEWGIESYNAVVRVAVRHLAEETRRGLKKLKGQEVKNFIVEKPSYDFR